MHVQADATSNSYETASAPYCKTIIDSIGWANLQIGMMRENKITNVCYVFAQAVNMKN